MGGGCATTFANSSFPGEFVGASNPPPPLSRLARRETPGMPGVSRSPAPTAPGPDDGAGHHTLPSNSYAPGSCTFNSSRVNG